jgi:hypothetical protein
MLAFLFMPSGCHVCNGLPPCLSRFRVAIRRRKCPTIQQMNEWTQKGPYKQDTLSRESTLCVAGALKDHKDLILLSCRLAMEHLCVLQLNIYNVSDVETQTW